MIRISKLKRPDQRPADPVITAFNEAIKSLEQQHYIFVEDLWDKIGPEFSEGIKQLEKETGVSYALLIQILADGSNSNAEEMTKGWRKKLKNGLSQQAALLTLHDSLKKLRFWLRQYMPETLAVVIIAVLLFLLVSHAARASNAIYVKSNLPAFHVLKEEDVEIRAATNLPGAFTSMNEVQGHYLLQQVSQGDRLSANQVSKTRLSEPDLAGRQVITLPVKSGAISQTLAPLDKVNLYFSPRQLDKNNAGEVYSFDDVIVLAINRQGDASSLVVAMSGDLSKVASLLGTYDLLIAQPMT